MAMGLSKIGSGGRRGRRRARRASLSEINVTPLVDVMLVLLIIFMISAPLLNSGIKLELPKTEAGALKDEGDPLSISIDESGLIHIKDSQVSFDDFTPRLMAVAGDKKDQPIYVRAAAGVRYENVAKVMAKLSVSGFTKINLLTDSQSKSEPKSAQANGADRAEQTSP
jgi:biopolymer transport protein TolR